MTRISLQRDAFSLIQPGITNCFTDWLRNLRLHLVVTDRCNLSCKHCYKNLGINDIDTQAALSLAQAFVTCNISKVMLTGGEIFLHPDINSIIREFHDNEIDTGIVSNGTQLSTANIRLLSETTKKISFSLDGRPLTHDSARGKDGIFLAVSGAITECLSNGIDVSIISTITSLNLDDIEWLVEYCAKVGVSGIRLQPASSYANTTESYYRGEILAEDMLDMFYARVCELSVRYAGQLSIRSVGIARKDAKCHGCLLGARYGVACHKKSLPWPHVFYISTNLDLRPLHERLPAKYILGKASLNLRDVFQHFYCSSLHEDILRTLANAYEGEILSDTSKYICATDTILAAFS